MTARELRIYHFEQISIALDIDEKLKKVETIMNSTNDDKIYLKAVATFDRLHRRYSKIRESCIEREQNSREYYYKFFDLGTFASDLLKRV